MSPTGAGPTARKAARLTASRALPRRWPASAAAQPSPGGAITTTAPVGVWVPRIEGGQGEGLLCISQFREVRVGVHTQVCLSVGCGPPRRGGGRGSTGRFPVPLTVASGKSGVLCSCTVGGGRRGTQLSLLGLTCSSSLGSGVHFLMGRQLKVKGWLTSWNGAGRHTDLLRVGWPWAGQSPDKLQLPSL